MMYKSQSRITWAISIILATIIIALVVVFVLGAVKDSPAKGDTIDAGESSLTNITDASGVRMTVRGPIVAEEVHKSYQVTIRPYSNVMNVYQGYLGTLLKSDVETNNISAYTEFAYSLARAGYMSGKEFTGEENNTYGLCSDGTLTTFEVLNGEEVVKSLWATSCRKDKESFRGDYGMVYNLYHNQILRFDEMLEDLGF